MKNNLSNIKKAINYLNNNECIGIPTETVYGLAANAYSDKATLKIFNLKKRPKKNPLIVHYYSLRDLKKDCLIDLKTTGDIKKFKRSANLYNYDSQAYIYQELFGKPLIFLVIDKTTHALGIFRPSEDFIRRGELKVERAIEVYNKFFSEDAQHTIEDYFIEEYID